MVGGAARWLSEKTGLGDPETVGRVASNINPVVPFLPPVTLPRSEDFTSVAQAAGIPLSYEAQSGSGEVGGRIGGMIPAVVGGHGRLASNTAFATITHTTVHADITT